LAPPPKQQLLDALAKRGVRNLGVGDAIIGTWHPNETIVLEAIHDLGLELHVVFNKAALDWLCLSEHTRDWRRRERTCIPGILRMLRSRC